MAASFPTSRKSFTTRSNGQTIDASQVNDIQDEITAMQKRAYGAPMIWWAPDGIARASRSFAYKGTQFTPSANMTLYGVRAYISSPAAAQTFKGGVITVSAGAIATITLGDQITVASSVQPGSYFLDSYFASGVSLTGGTMYGLIFGYSSSGGAATSTSDLPLLMQPQNAFRSMLTPRAGTITGDLYHIASLAPAVATSVTTAANDQNGYSYHISPIFDWA